MAAEKAAKPAHPSKAAFGPAKATINKRTGSLAQLSLPLADKMPPVKQPAERVLIMSCFARYYR
jgi:hypothetical protein